MKIAVVSNRDSEPESLRIACDINRACNPTWVSPISPSISARGTSAATESITTRSSAAERTSMSAISSACSPESGWETSSSSMLTPRDRAYVGSRACSASMNAAIPPLACASAMMCRQTVVLPDPSGPNTSTTRPRGMPPTPSARSSARDPVGMTPIPSPIGCSPSFITAPLPNCFSICCNVTSSILSRSTVPSFVPVPRPEGGRESARSRAATLSSASDITYTSVIRRFRTNRGYSNRCSSTRMWAGSGDKLGDEPDPPEQSEDRDRKDDPHSERWHRDPSREPAGARARRVGPPDVLLREPAPSGRLLEFADRIRRIRVGPSSLRAVAHPLQYPRLLPQGEAIERLVAGRRPAEVAPEQRHVVDEPRLRDERRARVGRGELQRWLAPGDREVRVERALLRLELVLEGLVDRGGEPRESRVLVLEPGPDRAPPLGGREAADAVEHRLERFDVRDRLPDPLGHPLGQPRPRPAEELQRHVHVLPRNPSSPRELLAPGGERLLHDVLRVVGDLDSDEQPEGFRLRARRAIAAHQIRRS